MKNRYSYDVAQRQKGSMWLGIKKGWVSVLQ